MPTFVCEESLCWNGMYNDNGKYILLNITLLWCVFLFAHHINIIITSLIFKELVAVNIYQDKTNITFQIEHINTLECQKRVNLILSSQVSIFRPRPDCLPFTLPLHANAQTKGKCEVVVLGRSLILTPLGDTIQSHKQTNKMKTNEYWSQVQVTHKLHGTVI